MSKLFSIVIFASGQEKIIACLNTIKKQNFYNYEIILISNCERQLSSILAPYSLEQNIKLMFIEGHKIEETRNEALKFCQGRYILFMQENEDYSENYLHECCKKVLISKNKLICTHAENGNEMNFVFGKIYDGELIRRNKIEFKAIKESELDFNHQYMKYSTGTVYCEKAICRKNC